MAQRLFRAWPAIFLALLVAAALGSGCWDVGSFGGLFGAPSGGGGSPGGNPGTGGGLALRDLFVNARILKDPPKVVATAPPDKATNVSVKTPLVLKFSESMVASAVRSGVALFPKGSTTAASITVTTEQGDSVAVVIPSQDLLPATDYELAVPGNLTDLQGTRITIPPKSTDERFAFKTISATGNPPFEVIFSTPSKQEANVPRTSEILMLFSEAFNTATSGGGINAPGNVVVKINGSQLTSPADYSLSTYPPGTPRVVKIVFTGRPAANATVEAIVSSSVTNADGRKTLKGGNGFSLSYTTQDAGVPSDISFPNSVPINGADGAISTVNLKSFAADVALTGDGQTPDTTTIIYFDKRQQNSLFFSATGARPTHFASDLEPQSTPALSDGDILVGAYVDRRGFRSEVSILKTLVKDTVGPHVLTMGPPSFGSAVLFTLVNDPVVHGRMSEPCIGMQIDFDGASPPDFNSIEFQPGFSSVTDDFFVTGTSEGAPITPQFEERRSFSFIASDDFGNTSTNIDQISIVNQGAVGAAIAAPDGTSALYVTAAAGDDFLPLEDGGAVILDAFPPEPPTPTHQIVKPFSPTFGLVRFTDAELASIPTSQITLTVVAQRKPDPLTRILYGPLTFAGLNKPTAASPRAVLAILAPDPSVDVGSDARADITGEGLNNPAETCGAFSEDLDPKTPTLERTTLLVTNPNIAQNIVHLPKNQLQSFTLMEEVPVGSGNFRFGSSEPFTSEPVTGGGLGGTMKTRTIDLTGQNTSYDAASNPNLVHTVQFSDSGVSGVGGTPGSLGLVGTEADQYRQWRMLCRAPGCVDNASVGSTFTFIANVDQRSADVLVPLPMMNNDSLTGDGFEDSPLELMLQPKLIDPATAVDLTILKRNLRAEMQVQDTIVPGSSTLAGGWVRERFVVDPSASAATIHAAAFQPTPTPSLANANHPPIVTWSEVTQGEGAHGLKLLSSILGTSWRIYLAAQAAGTTVTFQVPALPSTLPDGLGTIEFALPGKYLINVTSYDFDPFHVYSPATPEQYTFDFQAFYQSDLEREHLRASSSDPNKQFTTN